VRAVRAHDLVAERLRLVDAVAVRREHVLAEGRDVDADVGDEERVADRDLARRS